MIASKMSAPAHLPRPDVCHPKANDDCAEDWSYSTEAMLKYGNARALADRAMCISLFDQSVHAAILRALDEIAIRNEVVRGMCIEVGMEKAREVFGA